MMEIVVWLTVVAATAVLLLLAYGMWRSWLSRVSRTSSSAPVRHESGTGHHGGNGPVDAQYPPGSRPAGPGAEGMGVSSPGQIVPGWQNENEEEKDAGIEAIAKLEHRVER